MLIVNRLNHLFPGFGADPWRVFAAWGEQMLQELEPNWTGGQHRARAWKSDSGLIIDIDLPGRTADEMEVELEGRQLEIRVREFTPPEGNGFRSERSHDAVQWQWKLPMDVSPDAASVTYDQGVLRIAIHQSPVAPRQKLQVNAKS